MVKPRAAATTKATHSTDNQQPPLIDPLRLLWALTALTLVVILSYLHAFPQAPYPLHGIAPSLGLVVLAAASVLITTRSPKLKTHAFIPILLACFFFLWAAWRTWIAQVPSEGIPLLGTLLEGILVFAIALTLVAVGEGWTSFSLYEPSADAHREATRQSKSDMWAKRAHPLVLDGAVIFLLVLALAMALWAIYQYFVLYDQQAMEFRLRYGAAELEKLSTEDWALFEALRAKRVGSRFGNPNVLAGFLSMIAPLAIAAAVMWTDRGAKATALASLAVVWYVVLLTGSRGGMLTLLFATVAGVIMLGRETLRRQIVTLAIAVGVCIAAIALAVASESRAKRPLEGQSGEPLPRVRYSFFERLRSSPTIAQRLYYLQSGWEMIRLSPWLGHGLGSYAILYPRYKQPLAREARFPHNIFCHLWVETGLAGLFLWIAWVGATAAIGIARLRRLPSSRQATVIRMLLVATTVFLFNNLFEMTWTFREAYLDWCLLMGILAGIGAGEDGTTVQTESQRAAGRVRPYLGPIAITAVPLVLGVVLVNWLLIRPMMAESCQIAATDFLRYGQGKESLNEALRRAQQMIRYQPRNARYHHWLARFYQDLGHPQEARGEFEEALQLNPSSAAIRADFGIFEQDNGNTSEARRLLHEALEIYPLKARYHHLLAKLEGQVGHLDAARKQIRDALACSVDGREKPVFEKFLRDLDASSSPTR